MIAAVAASVANFRPRNHLKYVTPTPVIGPLHNDTRMRPTQITVPNHIGSVRASRQLGTELHPALRSSLNSSDPTMLDATRK